MTGTVSRTSATTSSTVDVEDGRDNTDNAFHGSISNNGILAGDIFDFRSQHFQYYQHYEHNPHISTDTHDINNEAAPEQPQPIASPAPAPPPPPPPPVVSSNHESTPELPQLPQLPAVPAEPPVVSSNYLVSRYRGVLQCVSSLAVPIVVVLLLLVPSVIVVVGLVGLCLIPLGALLCLGLSLHCCAPEAFSTVALARETRTGTGTTAFSLQQHQIQQRRQQRWDVDWTLANFIMEHPASAAEPRSRTDLEKALIVKRIVEPDHRHDQNQHDRDPLQQQQQSTQPYTNDDEEPPKSQIRNAATVNDKGTATEPVQDIETGCHGVNSTTRTVRTILQNKKMMKQESHVGVQCNKSNNSTTSSSTFDPTTMIRLNQISKSCCDICMMEYEVEDEVCESRNADCDHIFHKTCILDWMQKKHSCPCCRRNYLGEDDDGQDECHE